MEEAQQPSENKLVYSGNGNELAFLMLKNILLTIVTLGIYGPWARTRSRQYLWGHVSFQGDRATYTGTGKELFNGWIRVGIIYIVFFVVVKLLSMVTPLLGLVLLPVYIYLYALIIYGGTRYRLTRTKWREVYFGMEKNKALTREFILLTFKNVFFLVITFGIYYAFQQTNLRRFLVGKMRFGTLPFSFSGQGGDLFVIYLKGFFFSILTLGFYFPWFVCATMTYNLKHTNLDQAHFRLNLKGSDLLLQMIASYLLIFVTLGLATPWLLNWIYKTVINSITVVGEIDFAAIQNSSDTGQDATADVASVEYDVDLGF